MTVSTTLNKIIYAGNAGTTTFTFPFAFPGGTTAQEAANIQVFYTDPFGNVTLLIQGPNQVNYQIVFNPSLFPDPTPVGGTVTYNPPSGPIPLGSFLTIYRNLPLVQNFSFANQGTLYQSAVEQSLDYLLMVSQQVFEVQARALVVPVTDPVPGPLPAVAARAGMVLGFDGNGNPIAVTGGGGGGGGSGVTSFNARTGVVVSQANDYSFAQLFGNIAVGQMAGGAGAASNTFWRGDSSWSQVAFSNLTGNIVVGQMNAGAGASASTFWRGDGTWGVATGTPQPQRSVTTTPVVINQNDGVLNFNFSSPTTVNLPQASTRLGKKLTFLCLNAGTNAVTFVPFAGDTIVNWTTPLSLVVSSNGVVISLTPFNDGVNNGWFIG